MKNFKGILASREERPHTETVEDFLARMACRYQLEAYVSADGRIVRLTRDVKAASLTRR